MTTSAENATDLRDRHTFRGVVNNDPVVRSVIIITRAVTYRRPEQRVSLSGRPDTLQHLIRDVSVTRQPADYIRHLQRQFPLQPNGRLPEVVTQLVTSYTLQRHRPPLATSFQDNTQTVAIFKSAKRTKLPCIFLVDAMHVMDHSDLSKLHSSSLLKFTKASKS